MKRILLFCALVALASVASAQTFTGSITGTGIVGPFSSSGRNVVSVSIYGTYSGLSATFEFTDGVSGTWFSAYGVPIDASRQETGPTAITNVSRMWDISAFNTQQFRIRVTNFESGTANVVVVMSNAPIEVAPTVVTAPGSVVQVTGSLPNPALIQTVNVSAPPPLTPMQSSNILLYRAAMRVYCQTNLAGCAPGL